MNRVNKLFWVAYGMICYQMNNNLTFAKNLYQHASSRNLDELIEIVASWKFLFNDFLNEHCSPNQFFDGTLFIDCNPNCMIQLMEKKAIIIDSINTFFAKNLTKAVVLKPRFF